MQLVKVLYCKRSTNEKQLPAFPLEVRPGFELLSQKCEVRVLPLGHLDPRFYLKCMASPKLSQTYFIEIVNESN